MTALLLTLLGGCATVDFTDAPAGQFHGDVIVMWVGEGNASGDGRFLFVPDPNARLTFTRANPNAPGAVIKPGIMYTDGGSIPKIAQVFNGLSPWGYAPAYMIHDWLFFAHHCLIDGDPDPKFRPVADVDFDESARILGEAIQALVKSRQVKQNDVAGKAITSAVDSVVARDLWNQQGACEGQKVSAKHLAAAEAAIPGSTTNVAAFAKRERRLSRGPASVTASPVPAAKVIGRVSFGR